MKSYLCSTLTCSNTCHLHLEPNLPIILMRLVTSFRASNVTLFESVFSPAFPNSQSTESVSFSTPRLIWKLRVGKIQTHRHEPVSLSCSKCVAAPMISSLINFLHVSLGWKKMLREAKFFISRYFSWLGVDCLSHSGLKNVVLS